MRRARFVYPLVSVAAIAMAAAIAPMLARATLEGPAIAPAGGASDAMQSGAKPPQSTSNTAIESGDALERGFALPPDSARPWVFWFWMNGNISREGITKDLAEMKRVGVGGALIMEITGAIEAGPVAFMSDPWRELMKHAVSEAARLGLVIDMNNDAGWCGSGGPWVKPEGAMQQVTWSETRVTGPTRFSTALTTPPAISGFYRDIAVFALPTPPGEAPGMAGNKPRVVASDPRFAAAKVADGDPNTWASLPPPSADKPQFVTFEFARPFTARCLVIRTGPGRNNLRAKLQASDDGRAFKAVREIAIPFAGSVPSMATTNFAPVSARWFRLYFDRPAAKVARIALAEIELLNGARIEQLGGKAAFVRSFDRRAGAGFDCPPELAMPASAILDLTSKLDAQGRLTWDAPAGEWTILRVGHTPTGVTNHPSPAAGLGLECDKLSREALDAHFEGMMAKIIADAGPLAGKSLRLSHVDSWEVGNHNWTPKFREEFLARRGYDPLPWLPVMTGRVVQELDRSERFLWDVRRTIGELLADYYYGHLAELCHRHGMEFSCEPYGHGPIDTVTCGGRADMPMAEFWTGRELASDARCRSVASAGHVYGRRVIGAEAFTSTPENARWTNHPYSLKALGDWAYANGINRFVFHRFAHQPWLDRKPPAMPMGRWGINYEWTNTWWNQSAAWIEYLSRCQFLLQRGLFVADLLYFSGENSPIDLTGRGSLIPPPPGGYDYDECDAETLAARASVEDGRIALQGGMSYRMLILPDSQTITPQTLRAIAALVKAGATVMGPKPERSPSLEGYPNGDKEVQSLAAELWGDCDGKRVTRHAHGKGKVLWGEPLDKALASLGAGPDVLFRDAGSANAAAEVAWLHRRDGAPHGGETEIYFVANLAEREREIVASFRVAGRTPELWHPDTGAIVLPAVYRTQDDRSELPLRFDPCGSVFVVFRAPAVGDAIVSVARDGKPLFPPAPVTATSRFAADNNRSIADTFTMAGWVRPSRTIDLPAEARQGIANRAQNYAVYPAPAHEVYDAAHGAVAACAGVSVGANGVCVFEHAAGYMPAILVCAAPVRDWTHVAVVYRDKTPSLYLNGKLVRTGLQSAKTVHPSIGVRHERKVAPFAGVAAAIQVYDRALPESEIAALAASGPPRDAGATPTIELTRRSDGNGVDARVWREGDYEIRFSDGKSAKLAASNMPAPLQLAGPWALRFPPNWGAPAEVSLDKLISWTDHADPGVKHFSGTATYEAEFVVPADWLGAGQEIALDLGAVQVIAEVRVNGRDLGILWKPPFRVDITDAVHAGANRLEVRVTNLWPNRMIGDEALPPEQRHTWTPIRFFAKNEPLVESGLLGPVTLRCVTRRSVSAGE